MGSQDASPLRETVKDPFSSECSCRRDGLTIIITACVTFAMGVTIALIMQIYFGDPQVRMLKIMSEATCSLLKVNQATRKWEPYFTICVASSELFS